MANTEVVMKKNLVLRKRKHPKGKRIYTNKKLTEEKASHFLLKPLLGTELLLV